MTCPIRIADTDDRWTVCREPGSPTVSVDLDPDGPDAQPACLPPACARRLARALLRAASEAPAIDIKRLVILTPEPQP